MNQQMIMKLRKLQKEMQDTQVMIESSVFSGSVSGVVSVEVLGNKQIKSVKIDPNFSIEDEDDKEVFSDALIASCNQAYEKIEKFTEEHMGKYAALAGGGLF